MRDGTERRLSHEGGGVREPMRKPLPEMEGALRDGTQVSEGNCSDLYEGVFEIGDGSVGEGAFCRFMDPPAGSIGASCFGACRSEAPGT